MEWAGTILSLAQTTGRSPEEGIDSCLTRCVFKSVVWEWSGWFPVFDDALDVCDRRQGLMGNREEAGGHSAVDGGDGDAFIRSGTTWEATGSGSRGR